MSLHTSYVFSYFSIINLLFFVDFRFSIKRFLTTIVGFKCTTLMFQSASVTQIRFRVRVKCENRTVRRFLIKLKEKKPNSSDKIRALLNKLYV